MGINGILDFLGSNLLVYYVFNASSFDISATLS